MTTIIARTVARLVVPIILVTALALLLQGHNQPGGGFIAGVLTTTGLVLIYVVYGLDYVTTTLGLAVSDEFGHGAIPWYRGLFAAGLALAIVSGIVPILLGEPFLAQDFVIFHDVPLYGELHVASALAFDLGVYFTVVGALLTIVAVVGAE